jgi:hypothetical protein
MEIVNSEPTSIKNLFMIEIISLIIAAIGLTLIAVEITQNSMYESFIVMGVIPQTEVIKTIIGLILCAVAILIYIFNKKALKR